MGQSMSDLCGAHKKNDGPREFLSSSKKKKISPVEIQIEEFRKEPTDEGEKHDEKVPHKCTFDVEVGILI